MTGEDITLLPRKDQKRLAWLEAEIEDEPNRPLWGNGKPDTVILCRSGREVDELEREIAELRLKASRLTICKMKKQ
jgi:hypothetical protein